MANYTKQISSLTRDIVRIVKQIKETGEIAFITKVTKEIVKDQKMKGTAKNKFMVRDAIIYAAAKGNITINISGKQLFIDVSQMEK